MGNTYTRDYIHKKYGGSAQALLPTKNARVVCGCFKLEANPAAPTEVVVGFGIQRETSARTFVLQKSAVPIFIEREAGSWEYVGEYRATRYLHCEHPLLESDDRAKREDVAGILTLERCADPV